MSSEDSQAQKPFRFKASVRKPLSLSSETLIEARELEPGKPLPLLVQPLVRGLDLAEWARGNRQFIENLLIKHGAILYRGFNVSGSAAFQNFIQAVSDELLEYKERTSPRSTVSGHIYTSTDYPADQSIFFHNENSYQTSWPSKIFFYCETPPDTGGETPIADCREVLKRLSASTVARFSIRGWMYVRNFGTGLGIPWQTVFQTSDRHAVEQYCDRAGIECVWQDEHRLKTRQVRRAVLSHPRTGELVWFNHIVFFHLSTLPTEMREALLGEFDESEIPNNTYYGDGSPLEPEVVNEIRQAYVQESVSFAWQAGDILMLDNMLTAHSRAPYSGPRKILVGMSDPIILNH